MTTKTRPARMLTTTLVTLAVLAAPAEAAAAPAEVTLNRGDWTPPGTT